MLKELPLYARGADDGSVGGVGIEDVVETNNEVRILLEQIAGLNNNGNVRLAETPADTTLRPGPSDSIGDSNNCDDGGDATGMRKAFSRHPDGAVELDHCGNKAKSRKGVKSKEAEASQRAEGEADWAEYHRPTFV